MRAALAVTTTIALLVPAPARAYVPERTPHRTTEAVVARTLAQPAARASTPGVVVMRGRRTVVARNARTPLLPASLIKLATTLTALRRFGPNHRFPTRALAAGEGSRPGTMVLVGGGDPTLSTEAYRRRRFEPRPRDPIQRPVFANGSPTIEQLADAVSAAGITEVTGDLLADESLFDTARTQRGWPARYFEGEPETGLLSALTLNEGRANLARTRLSPSPALAAARAFRTALEDRDIRIRGAVRLGVAPGGAREIARVASPPLREIADYINRYSINFPAEILLKGIGARDGLGTTARGAGAVRRTLRRLDVPLRGFVMEDGSGLSRRNRVTPRTVAHLLDRVISRTGPAWRALRRTIPVAGRPGTLLRRLTGPPTGGNLRGKTGLLRGVRAMAGWVTPADGVPIVYVAMFNRAPSAIALTSPLDLLGLSLALLPRV